MNSASEPHSGERPRREYFLLEPHTRTKGGIRGAGAPRDLPPEELQRRPHSSEPPSQKARMLTKSATLVVMSLVDDEKFLNDHGWTWYVEALQFFRDHLSEEEKRDPARDGIERAKVDYYRFAISKLAKMQRQREGK